MLQSQSGYSQDHDRLLQGAATMDSRSDAHSRVHTLRLCLQLNAKDSVVNCSVKMQHEACPHATRPIENERGPSMYVSGQSIDSDTVSYTVARMCKGAVAGADLVVHRTHFYQT